MGMMESMVGMTIADGHDMALKATHNCPHGDDTRIRYAGSGTLVSMA